MRSEKIGVKLRSQLREEHYRDDERKLTRFKTGRRFVYMDIPILLLSTTTTKVGEQFRAFLFYREREDQHKKNNERTDKESTAMTDSVKATEAGSINTADLTRSREQGVRKVGALPGQETTQGKNKESESINRKMGR
ncbi:hypothetical protein ElyMa_003335800 [Elysia marginata]|uniref:Uncharacterized protein n=1 Tax=Elysia marginata TaxID=1093978 RepID=A0AAV4JHW9_9GAST|nr:hypothetical protein ElyMa_003335800 [Elysia marginata]